MLIRERAERGLDCRGLDINSADATDALGEEVREADSGHTTVSSPWRDR
jgi:hypothetical protein